MRPYHYLILILFSCNSIQAQKTNSNYSSHWHSADDNTLPQNSVKSIVKDKYGYIWLSTENGIVRYNGQHFKTFNSENSDGIKSSRMRRFYGDPSLDTLYIKNDVGQYFAIINRKFQHISDEKVALKFQSSFSKTSEGIAIEDKKVYLNKELYYKITPDYFVLLNKKNRKSSQTFKFSDTPNVVFIVDGNLFISEYGAEYFSLIDGKFYNRTFDSDLKIDNIYTNEAMQQSLLQAGKNLYFIELKNGKLQLKLVYSDYNKKDNIGCFFYDKITQTLYLGSYSKGLQVIKKKEFKSIDGKNESGVYYALLEEENSRIIAATGEIFGDEKDNVLNLNSVNDGYILKRDKAGNLWTKNFNVLICHTKNSSLKKSINWTFGDRITEIIEAKDGRIIVATSREELSKGKLYSMSPSKNDNSFHLIMNVNFITTFLLEDENNKFWTGTTRGFYQTDLSSKKSVKVGPKNETYVRNIYSKNHDEIWFATYDSGLYLYNRISKKLTHFPYDKDNFLLTSHCIVEDKKGFFWITTNKGLFQVSKENLLLYASGKTKNVYYHYYDKKSGFNTNEFNGGCNSCGVSLENGEFAFPSVEGIVHFNPENIKPLLPTNDIYFTEIEIDGKSSSFS